MKKFLILLLAVGLGFSVWYKSALRPVDSGDETRRPVTVEKGMSVQGIGQMLEEKGLIRSPLAFTLYSRLHRSDGSLQAGDFFLRKSMNVGEIVSVLRQGFSEEMAITIPEGFTVADIDALLASKGLTQKGDVIVCAKTCDFLAFGFLPTGKALAPRGGNIEGYLYPDTYFVLRDGFTPQAFLGRLIQTFDNRVATGLKADIAASGHSLHEIVSMASLIEEETRASEERPVVAGILWKRLANNVGLGVDATVRYVLEKPKAALTKDDLDVNSPYNLRRFAGLPPGPIASPSLSSIKAALHPEDSKYWYYLHGKDGKIRYAETNEEHNANRAKYL